MSARRLSEATDLLALLAILTKVAQEARGHGWTVEISCDASENGDRISFAGSLKPPESDGS